jgi:hypothetical protein
VVAVVMVVAKEEAQTRLAAAAGDHREPGQRLWWNGLQGDAEVHASYRLPLFLLHVPETHEGK